MSLVIDEPNTGRPFAQLPYAQLPGTPEQLETAEAAESPGVLDTDTLVTIARHVAEDEMLWRPHAVHDDIERHPVRLVATSSYEVWVIGWTRGQRVDLHDHGEAAGALAIVQGVLTELILDDDGLLARDLPAGSTVALPPGLVHEVVAPLAGPATSIHVYSPPISQMSFYDLGTGQNLRTELVAEDEARRTGPPEVAADTASAIARHLDEVRADLDRVEPDQLDDLIAAGALVVDIRPAADRAEDGELPGAVVVERIHLEWRLDPSSPDRLEQADGERQVIVVCNEGYASSLAAATLRQLGLPDATDLVGGYRAWAALRG